MIVGRIRGIVPIIQPLIYTNPIKSDAIVGTLAVGNVHKRRNIQAVCYWIKVSAIGMKNALCFLGFDTWC